MGLPTGPDVTFLFTDIEGSTRLEQSVGTAAWSTIVGRHDELLRGAIEASGGAVVKTEGDAFFAAFADPRAAVEAAIEAQRTIAAEDWPDTCQVRVRIGAHLGEGRLRTRSRDEAEDYVGIDVNYAARIAAAANGGQIVVSQALVDAIDADGVELADEGLRAVKDFEEPRRLHRIVVAGAADDTRRLRTLEPPSNLPGEATELVGREDEITLLRGVLAGNRIVTLTGPGGSGKTRLAVGVAQAVRDRFPHGTWFIDLAAIREPAMLEATIASMLGLRDSPERSMVDALRDYLRDRNALLLLDNLEQLLPVGADVVASIARGAPEVRFLITSRELLRIGGERGHPVPPLDVEAGVALFEARALAIRPDLALDEANRRAIRAICERLFGLPLAIELAAARVRMLSPALILERLASSLDLAGGSRDVPERQRTLRGAMAWSHDLLVEPERRLFRRLGVFAGGWTAELRHRLPMPPATSASTSSRASSRSPTRASSASPPPAPTGPGRLTSPGSTCTRSLREYALERLDKAGERAGVGGAPRRRHRLARRVDRRPDPRRGRRGGHPPPRPRAAQPPGRGGLGARRRRRDRGDLRHGPNLAVVPAARSVARGSGDPRSPARPAARRHPAPDRRLTAEGGLAYWSDDFPAARAAYEERLALADELGDAELLADAHYDLGFMFMIAQDPLGLRTHEQQALDLYVATGRQDGVLRARQALALALFLTGEYRRALDEEDQNLVAFRAAGSAYQVADSMTFHSGAHFKLGDPATSWRHMVEGLRWFADNDSASGIARAIGMAAILLLTDGDAEFGARVTGATYELVREKGVMLAPVKVLHLPDPAALATERLGEERARELMEIGATTPLDRIVAEVLAAPAPRPR